MIGDSQGLVAKLCRRSGHDINGMEGVCGTQCVGVQISDDRIHADFRLLTEYRFAVPAA